MYNVHLHINTVYVYIKDINHPGQTLYNPSTPLILVPLWITVVLLSIHENWMNVITLIHY